MLVIQFVFRTFSLNTASHASLILSQGRIRSVAISPDGRWLISGSGDRGTVRILDMIDASPQCVLGGQHKVWSVDFCSTSGYVACGYEGGNVSVWRYYEPSIA